MTHTHKHPSPTFQGRGKLLLRAIACSSLLFALSGCGGSGSASEPPTATPPVQPNPPANAKVDAFVTAELVRQRIPGLALVVQQNGKVVYSKGYGQANLAQGLPATTEQRFQIGSITKQFTAAAVLLLVQDGKMGLDEKIGKYLTAIPPQWEAITVRHLLDHTSGLPRDIDGSMVPNADSHGPYSADQMLAIGKTIMPLTEPGKVYAYSNIGYQLMGLIIEKVTGAFYGNLIQDRIFKPLGMTSARIIDFTDFSGTATGYVFQDNKLQELPMNKVSPGIQSFIRTAAGGIEMSATDLAKWDASLDTDQILSKSSRDLMWAPSTLVEKASNYTINYGLGWFLSDYNGHPKVYHSGGMASFRADYLRFTTDKLTVIVLTNVGESDANPETISRAVADMYVPGIWPPK